MAENLVNGDTETSVPSSLLTVNSSLLDTTFDPATDIDGSDEKAKKKSHHAEIEKRRKCRLNECINKLVEVLPDKDSKRSKTQILDDTYDLVVELKEKCNRLIIQNAPESEVDEIERLMEENARLKKENDQFKEFFRSMNCSSDYKTHIKAANAKMKKSAKVEPPSDELLGGSQNIIIQSPTATVMGSPNLVAMPTNQLTISSGNRAGNNGGMIQSGSNTGGLLLVTTSNSGTSAEQTNLIATGSGNFGQVTSVLSDKPEADVQSSPILQGNEGQTNQTVFSDGKVLQPSNQANVTNSAMTCTHEASNQSSVAQVNTTTAESTNTTAVTQVISTPITTPASQNTVLLQSGSGGMRLVQQPVQSQGQTVLIQLPGQPNQYVPVRIAPQVNQPQQVILTSQQGVNVIGSRGSAIQPKTPVKKKQPAQLKVKNLCPLQPDSRKPGSPIASQSNIQPIAPNTVTVRLPVGQSTNQQGTLVVNNQGQIVLQQQQPTNAVIAGNMNVQMPVQVAPKPQVTQNIVYIQQNGQLIPVILQQNSGVQQTVGGNTLIQGQQPLRVQVSQNMPNRPIQSGTVMSGNSSLSTVVSQPVASTIVQTSTHSLQGGQITNNQVQLVEGTAPSTVSSSAQVAAHTVQSAGSDLTSPLAVETSMGNVPTESDNMQGNPEAFATNDILAKAAESIFSSVSDTSPTMQLGDLQQGLQDPHTNSRLEPSFNPPVMKNSNGMMSGQSAHTGIDIYDLPDDMDTSSSKGKHKKKKKKKSKSKEKEKKKKEKDKEKNRKKIELSAPDTASSDNGERESGDVAEMNTILESIIGRPLNDEVIDQESEKAKNIGDTSGPMGLPVSSSGNSSLNNFSAEALLTVGTGDTTAANHKDVSSSISATVTSVAETNGHSLFGLGGLGYNTDILSNSMSVSGLPTYIDDEQEEQEIEPPCNSMDVSHSGSTRSSTVQEVPTTAAADTSVSVSPTQTGDTMSLTFPAQDAERPLSSEAKLTSETKTVTTPSDGFQNFLTPFSSISSLLEPSSNPARDASISSLPETSQKESSPPNPYSAVASSPYQHGWISHHSKASELARGIQPAKSQSPVSTGVTVTTINSNTAVTTTCTSVNMSAPVSSVVSTCASQSLSSSSVSKSSQPSMNPFSQPWLTQAPTESFLDSVSQSDPRGANLQNQQLADILQSFPALSDPKGPTATQSNTDCMSSAGDILSPLSSTSKPQSSLESFFGINTLCESRSMGQSSGNGDMFQGIASISTPSKESNQSNRDNFIALSNYPVTTSSTPTTTHAEQNSFMQGSSMEPPKDTSLSSSSKPVSSSPSYSLQNRLTSLIATYREQVAQQETALPNADEDPQRISNDQLFPPQAQENREDSGRSSENYNRHPPPKSRAPPSASLQPAGSASDVPSSQASTVNNQQQRRRQTEQNPHRKSQVREIPVKTFSTMTLHRTLTADISEEGSKAKEQEEELQRHSQPAQMQQPPQQQMEEEQREENQLPSETFRLVPEQLQQAGDRADVTQHAQIPVKQKGNKSNKKKPKGKAQGDPKKSAGVVDEREDLDSVGRIELDKALVHKFPWLAESPDEKSNNRDGKEMMGAGRQQMGQHTSNTNPFSVQSISQSSSKKFTARTTAGNDRQAGGEKKNNPPPYPSRGPMASSDGHNLPLWNPSSMAPNLPLSSASSAAPKHQPSHGQSQRQENSVVMSTNRQTLPNFHDGTNQNRSNAGGMHRPPMYEVSSGNTQSVHSLVQAAVSKASNAALLAQNTSVSAANVERSRSVAKSKKIAHRTEVVTSSQMLRQSDIDDSLDFLSSVSSSSAFPTSMASTVNMDMFGNSAPSSSVLTKQNEQPTQSMTRRPQPEEKQSHPDSANSSNLLSGDYGSNLTSSMAQDSFSFSQWNLEPTQTDVRESNRGNAHKIQELASPPQIQQMQRGGNNSVNLGFGDTSNLATGDDLDFSTLAPFQASNQPHRTPSDRQTPQTQTYSVPSGRSSVASMEPSPLQASPMNYNMQDGGHMGQMNDMPHSNSSSRGPPSVEAPQQQQQQQQQHRRMSQSPMLQSSHTGQGVKRPAGDAHHMNLAKKANPGAQAARRTAHQTNLDSRQHSNMHGNQQQHIQGNAVQFQSQNVNSQSQAGDISISSVEAQRANMTSQSGGRNHDGNRSKKRTQNPSDIFNRDPHEVDSSRSTSMSLLQDSVPWASLSTSQRSVVSSSESTHSTFLPNFSTSSQTPHSSGSQSESVPSSSSNSSLISPSRRLRHSEMPTYFSPPFPGAILQSPPQSKSNLSRETDITPSFNTMFSPARAGGLHGVGMSTNFPVFDHQPSGGFNISKSNQLTGAGMTSSFNFNNIFNDSSSMTGTSHISEAPPLNHGIGLPPTVHLHSNPSIPVEDSVLQTNMGQRHAGQHFANMRVDSLLGQNRTGDVRPHFKVGVPPPMGMPQHFHGSTFSHSMPPY
ncbi:uncharacterized protein [Diadema antillarum]|uniref:uncharacterized protein n=1 Tax=Diadema antillarum TaxID=105358 RepID=UPI003A8C739F